MSGIRQAAGLEFKLALAVTALERCASEFTAYSSEEDSVGHRPCCGVASFSPHRPECWLMKAIASVKS